MVVNSMETIVLSKSCKSFSFDEIWNSTQIENLEFNGDKTFCDSWRLSILTPVDIGTCHLLGHSFGPKTANLSILIKFCTLRKPWVVNSMVKIFFLCFLTPVNIDNCQYWYLLSLGHKFRPKTVNAPVLMQFCTLHETIRLDKIFRFTKWIKFKQIQDLVC